MGDIRLVGGVNSYEGRVEIFINGTWGTVCQDHFHVEEAAVACKQLGLETSSVLKACQLDMIIFMHYNRCSGCFLCWFWSRHWSDSVG